MKKIIVSILGVVFAFCLFFIIALSSANEEEVSSDDGAGFNLPLFVTDEMMKGFFETQAETGVPVSSGVAQLIGESGYGVYGPNGENGQGLSKLAYNYKNLFGIKYFSGDKFATGSINFSTGEETSGGDITIIAGFSTYDNYIDCIKQRAEMLKKEPYYSKTLAVHKNSNDGTYTKENAKDFISGIRLAGWATDTSYVTKCVGFMDKYSLYQFDNMDYNEYQAKKNLGGGGDYDGVVSPLMQIVVDNARNNNGTYPCTPDMCGAWVTGIYIKSGVAPPYGNAIDMWNNWKGTGSTSQENIPPGAIVCGTGSGYMGSIYGHVGIYLGGGMVANNIGFHSVVTLDEWISQQSATCQGQRGWLGWVYPNGRPY